MKHFSKLLTASTFAAVALGATVFGFNGAATANASCRWQYTNGGDFTTSQTPVFNSICNVPNGVGNEPDFVQLRQSANGNNEDNKNNPNYTHTLNATCNVGDKFDINTYIHNDALSQFNDNGNGSAVAHDVAVAMTAPLGTTSNHFTFGSTVTASNAETVSDTASLGCGSNVKLVLVPHTVHVYSQPYGWQNLSDGAVNGTTPLGSPTAGSGNQWGCWQYRVVVVYQVTVEQLPPPTPVFTCDELDIATESNRTIRVTAFNTSATNGAVFKDAVINWGDNSAPLTSTNPVGQTHQFGANGTFTVTATAHFTVNGQDVTASGPNCVKTITVNSPSAPVFICEAFDLTADVNRTVKISNFAETANNGAVFTNVVINWGDNSAPLTSTNPVGQTHQFGANGTFTVTATAHFTVNGQDVTASGPNCTKVVTFQPNQPPTVTPPPSTTVTTAAAPTTLVNTGPGSIAGLFAAATTAGTLAYRRMLSRRTT